MNKHKDKLVEKKQFEIATEKLQDKFFELKDKIGGFYKYQDTFFDALDDLSAAIGELSKKKYMTDGAISTGLRRASFVEVPSRYYDDVREVASLMRDMPTKYFEAKKEYAVGLNRFSGAVVPDNVSQETLDLLRRNGIEDIQYYKYRDEGSRKDALGKFEGQMFEPSRKYGKDRSLSLTLDRKLPDKFSAKQLNDILRSGEIKQDEIKWSEIEDFLREKSDKREKNSSYNCN